MCNGLYAVMFATVLAWPAVAAADALKAYEGVYRINPESARVLRVVGGKLTSQRTGSQPYTLIPVAQDVFLFEEGLSRMVLERDAAGKVRATPANVPRQPVPRCGHRECDRSA